MEPSNILRYARIAFLAGSIILFVSFFVDWYQFQVLDENGVEIAFWSYNLFFEWDTSFTSGNPVNEQYRPVNLGVPLLITLLCIILLMAAVFTVLFRDVEHSTASLRMYSFLPLFLAILTVFYIMVFPIMYLLPNKLYFPSLTITEVDTNYTYVYAVSVGYILQLCGFLFIFPSSLYYYVSIIEQEKQRSTPLFHIEKIISNIQEELNLDKFIAEEVEELRRS
ncbi:MAG: hypothetical protein ACFFA3_11215 [Promethearchaeota archaeon]